MSTRIIMLLDLDWAGEVRRLGSETVEVEIDGEALLYPSGLTLDYEETLDRTALEPPELGASFEGLWGGLNWAALRAQGHRWSSARGAVWMVVETGGVMGDPVCLLRGLVRGIEFGDPDQPSGYLRGRVEALATADTSRLVPASWMLTATAWPELADDTLRAGLGKFPAQVFGRPGLVRGATNYVVAAVPAYVVEWSLGPVADTLLLAGHTLTETSVVVTDGTVWESFAVTNVVDGDVRTVPTVDLSTAVYLAIDTATEYWWACTATTGPGSLALASDRPGLGSVVLALLERSSLQVDHARMAPAVEVLDQIEVGGAVVDPEASAWDVVSELLKLYPCAVRVGPDGIYVVPLVQPARAEDCAHQLLESTLINREGAVEVIDIQAPSRIEVAWGIAQDTGTPSGLVQVLLDPTDEDGVLIPGAEGAMGDTFDPEGEPLRLEAPAVYDEASARRAALAQLLAYPPGQERLELTLPAELHTVELGQWVALDSDTLGRVIVGQVIRRRWVGEDAVWSLSLLCDETPDRDAPASP